MVLAAKCFIEAAINWLSLCLRSGPQRAHWQAHDASVTSVDYVPARPFANSSCGGTGSASMVQPLIVSAGRDSNVAVWTIDGGLVGLCGDHSWDLDKQDTWQDAAGAKQRPPRPEAEGMFLKVGAISYDQCYLLKRMYSHVQP
jgi:hypothetical protein